MKRHDIEPLIPPFVNRFGHPTFENPYGQNRPNPALALGPPGAIAQAEALEPRTVAAHTRPDRLAAQRPRIRRRVQGIIAALVTVVGSVAGVHTAAAYFTSDGAGNGNADVGTLAVTVNATTGTPTTPLIPGSAGDVTLQVDNPNSFAVTLTSVTGTGVITPDAGHSGCSPTGVTFTDQSGLSVNIPANGTTPIELTGAASMSTLSDSACQGATFTIPVEIGVQT
jgi:hypothetical protein